MRKAAEPTERTANIPEIRFARLVIEIEGISSLIVHRFGDNAKKQIEDKQQQVAALKRGARDPEAEFRDALYVINADEERYGFPAGGIQKALVSAGFRFAGEKSTFLKGVFTVQGDLLEIKGPPPRMRSDYVRLSDLKRTASVAYRPEFLPWEMEVPIAYVSTMIQQDQLINLMNLAGFTIGIGDWRPEKSGTHGQFRIKSMRSEGWQ